MACLIAVLESPAVQGSFPGFACKSVSLALRCSCAQRAELSPQLGSEQRWAKWKVASAHVWVKAAVPKGDAYRQLLASTSANPPVDQVFTGIKTV